MYVCNLLPLHHRREENSEFIPCSQISMLNFNRLLQQQPCWKTKQYNLSPLGNDSIVIQTYFIVLSSNMAAVVRVYCKLTPALKL